MRCRMFHLTMHKSSGSPKCTHKSSLAVMTREVCLSRGHLVLNYESHGALSWTGARTGVLRASVSFESSDGSGHSAGHGGPEEGMRGARRWTWRAWGEQGAGHGGHEGSMMKK